MIGCDDQPDDTPTDAPVTQPATPPPKPTMRTLEPIDGTPTLTEDSLRSVEQKYSCELPDDYRRFLLANNGAFPSPDCVTFEEAGRQTASDVFCFLAIDDERAWASLEWHFETYSGRLPNNTLPIARDSGGNLWLLSVRSENAGSIFFWDHGSFDTFDEADLTNWPLVAASFQEFWDSLGTFDASAADNVVPSRYSLVKQATDGMAKKDSGFSTRANPGFVWHCDCDDDGNVSMQFVRYEIHAVAAHTCGYSRLCAIKGLIKGGQLRLP
jgi:hypothetical protein